MSNIDHNDDTLDSLDETLDDLADLPQNKPFPAGTHLALLKIRKNPKKAGQYVVEMTHQETVELANPNTPEEEQPKMGDKSTVFISTKKKNGEPNDIGQGQLKIVLSPIGRMLETNSIGAILENTKEGILAAVTLKIKADTSGNYDDQNQIVSVQLP